MSKILDSDFRKGLYRDLIDAGYDKSEATSIVSVKYCTALKGKLIESLNAQIQSIEEDKNELLINIEEISNGLSELAKLKEFFEKKS